MLFKRHRKLNHDEARAFLASLSLDPENYLTDLLNAHHEALSDAQDLITTRGWTRGEVLAFCTSSYDLNLFPHQDCQQRLAMIHSSTAREEIAATHVEDPDTWCDRCDEIARDGLLGVALVTVWRAWRLHNDGPVGQWIETLPRVSPRNL